MNIFRNRNTKICFAVQSAVTILGCIFLLFVSPVAAAVCLIISAVIIGAGLYYSAKEYRQLSKLSDEIDKVLAGAERMEFTSCNEGDISILACEIQKMTLRLREQNCTLREDKLLMKNSMADISHQLRTPLTSMNLILTQLGKSDLDKFRRMEYVGELSRLISHTQWLIDVILKLSQLDARVVEMRPEDFQLSRLIRESISPFEISMELKEITLSENIPQGCVINGDFKWCCEAVGNILKNCCEHTPDGGEISIIADDNKLFTEIFISDSGKGIPQKDIANIFQRFYRSEDFSATGGYGIGLALAKDIVKLNNGVLRAFNNEKGNPVFAVRFYRSVV